MTQMELFISLLKSYGPVTGIALFNLWIYVLNPYFKKQNGKFVSYKTIHAIGSKQEVLTTRVEVIETKVSAYGTEAAGKDRHMEAIEISQIRFDRDLEEMKFMMRDYIATQKTTNRLLGENKDTMRELLTLLTEAKNK